MEKFRFPKLNANIEEATITKWHKAEGETVSADELLLEIATDKGVTEIHSSVNGVVRRIVAPENSTLPVGYIIALIGEPDEYLPDIDAENAALLRDQQNADDTTDSPRRTVKKKSRSRVRASPSARRLAREHNVQLADIKAHFQTDMVSRSHVEAYLGISDAG